jgi:hypothetical protein
MSSCVPKWFRGRWSRRSRPAGLCCRCCSNEGRYEEQQAGAAGGEEEQDRGAMLAGALCDPLLQDQEDGSGREQENPIEEFFPDGPRKNHVQEITKEEEEAAVSLHDADPVKNESLPPEAPPVPFMDDDDAAIFADHGSVPRVFGEKAPSDRDHGSLGTPRDEQDAGEVAAAPRPKSVTDAGEETGAEECVRSTVAAGPGTTTSASPHSITMMQVNPHDALPESRKKSEHGDTVLIDFLDSTIDATMHSSTDDVKSVSEAGVPVSTFGGMAADKSSKGSASSLFGTCNFEGEPGSSATASDPSGTGWTMLGVRGSAPAKPRDDDTESTAGATASGGPAFGASSLEFLGSTSTTKSVATSASTGKEGSNSSAPSTTTTAGSGAAGFGTTPGGPSVPASSAFPSVSASFSRNAVSAFPSVQLVGNAVPQPATFLGGPHGTSLAGRTMLTPIDGSFGPMNGNDTTFRAAVASASGQLQAFSLGRSNTPVARRRAARPNRHNELSSPPSGVCDLPLQQGSSSSVRDVESLGNGFTGLPDACPVDDRPTEAFRITQPSPDDSLSSSSTPPGVLEVSDVDHESEDEDDESSSQGGDRFDFGKHNGRTYREVAINHPDYGEWALQLSNPSPPLSYFCAWYRDHGRAISDRFSRSNDGSSSVAPTPMGSGDRFDFGKHKGRTNREVAINHPDYGEWALQLSNPSPPLSYFCAWYRDHGQAISDRFSRSNDGSSSAAATPMGFGKYSSLTYAQVVQQDPGYCRWALRENYPGWALRKFRDWLILNDHLVL